MLSIKSLPKLQIGPDCFLFFLKWSHLLHPIQARKMKTEANSIHARNLRSKAPTESGEGGQRSQEASRFCIGFILTNHLNLHLHELLHLPKIQAWINIFDSKTSSASSSQNPSLNQQIQQQNYQIRQQNYQIRSSPLHSDYSTPNYQIRLILSRKKALAVVFLAHRFLIFLISSFSHLQRSIERD